MRVTRPSYGFAVLRFEQTHIGVYKTLMKVRGRLNTALLSCLRIGGVFFRFAVGFLSRLIFGVSRFCATDWDLCLWTFSRLFGGDSVVPSVGV